MLLDGPYGGDDALDSFDTVMFWAGGIGIVSHLLHLRQMVQAHNDRKARLRRLTLVWMLESWGMSQPAREPER